MAHTSGYKARWAVKGGSAPRNMASGSERWAFKRDTVRRTKELLVSDAIYGSRSVRVEGTRGGVYRAAGQLAIDPSFAFLDAWLPRILGATESADTFHVADSLQEWDMMSDRGAQVVRYNDMKVAKATLTFKPGLLDLALDVMGLVAVETGNSFPSLSLGTTDAYQHLTFHESVFSLEPTSSGDGAVREGIVTIDNMCEELFGAGESGPESIREGGRLVQLTLTNGINASDWSELYGTETPWDATITMALQSMSSVITLRNLQAPRETPVIDGKGEVTLGLTFQAFSEASNNEISWTNDPVN